MFGHESAAIESDLRCAEDACRTGLEIVAINRRRVEEGLEGVEHLAILPLAGDGAHRAERGKLEILHTTAVSIEHGDTAVRVGQIGGDEFPIDDAHVLEYVFGLGDDLFHVPALGSYRDHPVAGRVEVGQNVQNPAIIADELVARVEVVEKLHDGAVETRLLGVDEIEVVQTIALVGPVPHVENGVVACIRDRDAETPFGLIGAFVDEPVFRLRCPATVVVDLLVQIDAPLRLVVFGLRIARVEETFIVVGPGRARELDEAQMVGLVFRGLDIADAELLPVGAARGDTVSEPFAVVAEGKHRERGSALFGERVRVEKDLGLRVERLLLVQDGLVLEPVIFEKDTPDGSRIVFITGSRDDQGRGKNNYQVFVVIHLLQGERSEPAGSGSPGGTASNGAICSSLRACPWRRRSLCVRVTNYDL